MRQQIPDLSPSNRILLLLDGHVSRFTLEAIKEARAAGVDVQVFPPNCTHFLQPWDQIFGPIKQQYAHVYGEWMQQQQRSGESTKLDKATWLGLVDAAFALEFEKVPGLLANAFSRTGLWPADISKPLAFISSSSFGAGRNAAPLRQASGIKAAVALQQQQQEQAGRAPYTEVLCCLLGDLQGLAAEFDAVFEQLKTTAPAGSTAAAAAAASEVQQLAIELRLAVKQLQQDLDAHVQQPQQQRAQPQQQQQTQPQQEGQQQGVEPVNPGSSRAAAPTVAFAPVATEQQQQQQQVRQPSAAAAAGHSTPGGPAGSQDLLL